jgi:hypothetical protein
MHEFNSCRGRRIEALRRVTTATLRRPDIAARRPYQLTL